MQSEFTPDLFGFSRGETRKGVAAFDGGSVTSDAGRRAWRPQGRSTPLSRARARSLGLSAVERSPAAITRSAMTDARFTLCLRISALRRRLSPSSRAFLDLAAADDPPHGPQEGRFLHGSYDGDCYKPLSIFGGRHLLAAKLRPAHINAAAGALEAVTGITKQIGQHWPADTHPAARQVRRLPGRPSWIGVKTSSSGRRAAQGRRKLGRASAGQMRRRRDSRPVRRKDAATIIAATGCSASAMVSAGTVRHSADAPARGSQAMWRLQHA
jgi:hypothetical protein